MTSTSGSMKKWQYKVLPDHRLQQPLAQEHGQNAFPWNLELQQADHLQGYLENCKVVRRLTQSVQSNKRLGEKNPWCCANKKLKKTYNMWDSPDPGGNLMASSSAVLFSLRKQENVSDHVHRQKSKQNERSTSKK